MLLIDPLICFKSSDANAIIIALRKPISCTFNGDLIEFMQRECGRAMLVFQLIQSFILITDATTEASRMCKIINSRNRHNELISAPIGEVLMRNELNPIKVLLKLIVVMTI